MSMHIAATVFWGGNVFFITDTDEVWRVWIGGDYYPLIERLTNDSLGDYSWPIQELRKIKAGMPDAKEMKVESLIISACCGRCGCPILKEEPHHFHKGIAEHEQCPGWGIDRPDASRG